MPKPPAKWQKIAEERCAERGERLTPARLGAYAELLASGRPLTAYQLVAALEGRLEKKLAPLTVYRHLDFLMRVGLVHRLESTQSYLPCVHPHHAHESQYLLCSSCGNAQELESRTLVSLVGELAEQQAFEVSGAVVEVLGRCRDCVKADAG